MSKRLLLSMCLAAGLSVAAIAQETPASTEDCLQVSIDLAKSAEDSKLPDDKLAKIEDLLTKMEGHCEASQFTEALAVAKDTKAVIEAK